MQEEPLEIEREDDGAIVATVDPELGRKLARGMAAVAKIARLYKKHGGPPKWIARQKEGAWSPAGPNQALNHGWKRALRLTMRPRQRPQAFQCGTCNKPFVGPASNRCQCKPIVMAKHGRRQ